MKKVLLIGSILTITVGVFVLNASTAFAVTAGPNNAGTGANIDRSGESTIWSNPGNITVIDSPYATATLGNHHSDYLQATNYGFSIPDNATITGIVVSIRRQSSSNADGDSIDDDVVSLIKGGTITGDNKAVSTDWPTSFGVANYGGTSDLWETTWTSAQINASNFGVALSVETEDNTDRTATVDYISVTVYYTPPTPVPFTETFGISNSETVSGWIEHDSAIITGTSSGEDQTRDGNASNKFVKIGDDGSSICRTFDASDDTNLVLSYFWKGDLNAGSGDHGVVQYRLGGCTGGSTSWTNINSHSLNNSSWSSQVSFNFPPSINNSIFSLRFRNNANHSNEYFRVDDILLAGVIPDTTPPVVAVLPSSQTIEATSASGATALYTVTAIDDVDGPLSASCTPPSGSTFSLGDTTVTCSATDSHGNTGTGTATVTVHDTTPPVISPHSTVVAEATSPAGANVTYISPNANDIVDGIFAATCLPASGSSFSFGDATVTCNATDVHSNVATSTTFTVTVHDTTKPVITLLGENPIELHVLDSYVDAGATASDNIDGIITGNIVTTGSVNTAVPGTYHIYYDVSDNALNPADQKVRTITVSDVDAPVINTISDMTVEATGPLGATVTFGPVTATDDVDESLSVSCDPVSGSTFPIGSTVVTCTATDSSGNVGVGPALTITVRDTTPPVVTVLPASQTVEATSAFGAVAPYSVTAIDIVDGDISDSATCDYTSGSTFPLGDTIVTCSATDSHGNTGTGTATITVSDTTPPVITPPADQSFEATGVLTAPTLDPATAVDVVDPSPVINYTPKSFPLGITDVTWTATDDADNSSSTSSKVTITDPWAQSGSSILLVPEDTSALCSDNNDNDRNGLTDLDDPNCAPFVPVVLGTSTSTEEVLGTSTSTVGEVLGTSTECLPPINQFLYFGGKNDPAEVTKLQEFLNSSMGANLTVNGIFDLPTLKAVKDFQLRFKILLLRPWVQYGHPNENTPTGNVFKLTLWLINVLRCPSSGQLMPTLP